MSKKQDDLIADLQETFNNLRKYNMMLNPTKCVFGVPARQLLGFIISHHGIEVNPEKIKAILEISRPNDLKDVQPPCIVTWAPGLWELLGLVQWIAISSDP
jgi:hypothetical protein